MRHVVVDALDSGARTEVVPEMVADSLGKRVVGDPGGHDEVDVLKTDVRDPKTGLDGVIGKVTVGGLVAEISLFFAGRNEPAVDGEGGSRFVLAYRDAPVKAQGDHDPLTPVACTPSASRAADRGTCGPRPPSPRGRPSTRSVAPSRRRA